MALEGCRSVHPVERVRCVSLHTLQRLHTSAVNSGTVVVDTQTPRCFTSRLGLSCVGDHTPRLAGMREVCALGSPARGSPLAPVTPHVRRSADRDRSCFSGTYRVQLYYRYAVSLYFNSEYLDKGFTKLQYCTAVVNETKGFSS